MNHPLLLEDKAPDSAQASPSQIDYPLHQAIKDENSLILSLHIRSKKEINPNQHNLEGKTPLWCAVNTLNLEIISAILSFESIDPNQQNIHPNKESIFQDTPLRLAVSYHDATIIAKLITAKANSHQQYIHLKNPSVRHGQTPYDSAKAQGNKLMIQAFENPKNFSFKRESTIQNLCKALEEKTSDQNAQSFIATRLKSIKNTSKVALTTLINTYDIHGHLPLYWAIKCDLAHHDQSLQCTQLLISERADPNTLNRRQETLLYSIIRDTKNLDAVKFLLEKGARIESNGDLNNPFHIAAWLKRADIIRLLNQYVKEDQEALKRSKNYQKATPRQLAQKDMETLTALYESLKSHSSLATIGEVSEDEISEGESNTRPRFGK